MPDASIGTATTPYGFTGEMQGVGGLYLRARYYDSHIARFTTQDPWQGDPTRPGTLNAYAYVLNNPVRFTDPSGKVPSAIAPDWRGLRIVAKFMNKNKHSIVVAAAIAIQSQYYGIWDAQRIFTNKGSSGLGPAQVSDEQMCVYGLDGQNQIKINVAIEAMKRRIEIVQNECEFNGTKCTARDLLVVAALAQNGTGFTDRNIKDIFTGNYFYNDASNNIHINWLEYFDTQKTGSKGLQIDARIRQKFIPYKYNTEYMLLKYTKNLRELIKRGWSLPDGNNIGDLDFMEDLATKRVREGK